MKSISYTKTIQPFHQKTILFQLAIAIGIPFGLLLIFLILIKAKEALFLLSLFLILSGCVVFILFGKIEVTYKIDHTGITSEPSQKQYLKNTRLNRLTRLVGIISGNLSVVSTAYLSQSNQIQYFRWNQIKLIKNNGNTYVITNLQNQKLILITNQSNHNLINEILQERVKGKKQ